MSGSVYAIAAMVLAVGTATVRADDPNPPKPSLPVSAAAPAVAAQQTKPATQPPAPASTAQAPTDTPPKIVVHQNAAPVQASDGRVQIGAMKISMSPWASGGADPAARAATESSTAPTSGAIAVPANTLGPGEPYWRTQERADAERRLADARIEHAEADALRATRQAGRDHGYIFFGNSYLNGGWHTRNSGLRGPITTTTTYSDQLGSTAQRAFADAAYPRLNGTTEARDAIVRQFGRDAAPPITRIQNDVDAIHRRANSESPK